MKSECSKNPIANHAGWQGKVFKIHGSEKDYPNLKESTGYPDDILGLAGVNCRHRMFPFVPGASTPNPTRFSEEENRKQYELSQKQRAFERKIRSLKKQRAAAQAIGDGEQVKKLNKKLKETGAKYNEFCKENKLKRDYSRELVSEQLIKKNVAKSQNSDIIKARSENMTISSIEKPIDLPIEQRNTGKGNPNAILQFNRPLNNRQQLLLEKLPSYDSQIIVSKRNVKMSDLAALTAATGDEFAMFTKNKERLIIRGNPYKVNIDIATAKKLAELGYRWSGHTHPGVEQIAMFASDGDKAILNCFKQTTSAIYNSQGQFFTFGKE